MVAKITIPKSMEAALNYNEKKVQKGQAICLFASNYLLEAKQLNFYQKMQGFERLNMLNERATTKTLHVSLNFDPSEKLSDEKLTAIAITYMDKIGFGQQPFLVYQHLDAGHPHIHIVSNTIREDGSRINTHNMGRNQSEKARKEIEQLYGLVKAEQQQKATAPNIKAVDLEKAVYGKVETKRSISNVITAVFNQYRFSSLPEFNAVLKQFNVIADRGNEDGRIYKNRGLVYRLLDVNGNKIGVPIKASAIHCQPTLDNLEKKFSLNEGGKAPFKQHLKNTIDAALLSGVDSMANLVVALAQQQVSTVLRQNTEGRLYGITFVDNNNKTVFNGSDIGKAYSAAALMANMGNSSSEEAIANKDKNTITKDPKKDGHPMGLPVHPNQQKNNANADKNDGLLDILLSPQEQFAFTPNQLLKKKRKKKKKNNDF